MEYNKISIFLDKIKKNLFKKEEMHQKVSEEVSFFLKKNIDTKTIKIKNGSVYIESSPILKNEILINKEKIILSLKEKYPNFIIKDIK